ELGSFFKTTRKKKIKVEFPPLIPVELLDFSPALEDLVLEVCTVGMSIASVALSPALEEVVNFPGFIGRFGLDLDDPILIFLSISGSLSPLRVMESDLIASVKLRIQSIKGFFVKKQKLGYDVDGRRRLISPQETPKDFFVEPVVVNQDIELPSLLKELISSTIEGLDNGNGPIKSSDGSGGAYFMQDPSGNKYVSVFKPIDEEPMAVNNPHGQPVSIDGEGLKKGTQPVFVNREIELAPLLKELINSTLEGLEKGNGPIKSSDGSGGAYFMQDPSGNKYVSVFKPIDEEPLAVNNPHGQPVSVDGEGLKKGTQVGEGAFREVAAYILDYPMIGPRTFPHDQSGFAGVPPTTMVKCLHKDFNHPNGYSFSPENTKIGSLQMFVSNVGTCEDMGYGVFPVDQVHKISVLDIRLANADRHGGNILVSRDGKDGQIVLTPIDHGYCFPNKFEDCTFEWLYWPQAKEPYSSETLEYIKSLDAEQDIELLRLHGWEIPPSCARVFRISTMLLMKGAAKGLTPFAIGSMMCRETLEKESVIEQIINDAEAIVFPETAEEEFISTVSAIMDCCLDQIRTRASSSLSGQETPKRVPRSDPLYCFSPNLKHFVSVLEITNVLSADWICRIHNINKISESVGESFDSLLRQSPHNRPAPLKSLEGIRLISPQETPKDFFVEPVVVNQDIELPSLLKELISSTIEGLDNGNGPIKSSDGSGGAYFMQDPSGNKYVSVFKPIDEEPMAVNNPHGQPVSIDGEGLKKGTQVGEGAFREVAAYMLDYPMTGPRAFPHDQSGFAGVPPTTMVKCLHKDFNHPNGYSFSPENTKIGSLQMFVSNVGTCEDMGYGVFPVDQVHKISVLDIRLANADRHGGNILVSREGKYGQIVLTPIDHGYCFPNKFEDCTFEWLYWPQAKEPYSPETLEYIKSLDAEQDIELLRIHGWEIPPSCARVYRISTMLLKKGAVKGLTPFAIGSIMCRETLNKESVIEQIINDAEAIVLPETTEEEFISTVSAIMDCCLDQYSRN
ncbi:hypothetical protein F2Q68_00036799, partial [Brassica cretica]